MPLLLSLATAEILLRPVDLFCAICGRTEDCSLFLVCFRLVCVILVTTPQFHLGWCSASSGGMTLSALRNMRVFRGKLCLRLLKFEDRILVTRIAATSKKKLQIASDYVASDYNRNT